MTDENSVVDTAESEGTGDSRVDGILTLLGDLEEKPVEEHAEVFLELHARLQGELNPGAAARRAGPHGTA